MVNYTPPPPPSGTAADDHAAATQTAWVNSETGTQTAGAAPQELATQTAVPSTSASATQTAAATHLEQPEAPKLSDSSTQTALLEAAVTHIETVGRGDEGLPRRPSSTQPRASLHADRLPRHPASPLQQTAAECGQTLAATQTEPNPSVDRGC